MTPLDTSQVKTTEPMTFSVKPASGILESGKSGEVQIQMKTQGTSTANLSTGPDGKKRKFLIQYRVLAPGDERKEMTELFAVKTDILEYKLTVSDSLEAAATPPALSVNKPVVIASTPAANGAPQTPGLQAPSAEGTYKPETAVKVGKLRNATLFFFRRTISFAMVKSISLGERIFGTDQLLLLLA